MSADPALLRARQRAHPQPDADDESGERRAGALAFPWLFPWLLALAGILITLALTR